jgi:ubiquinone/menaquinone biosynthesis C-methylase UbiE
MGVFDIARRFDRIQTAYILGHTDFEMDRLQLQASIIAGVTRRLIRESGIGAGMTVLDIGCGPGDVSLLLAEAVGRSGRVVAFDREERAIEAARKRARSMGYDNIEFIVSSDKELPQRSPFDAAIGRYVLIHQPDAPAMVQRAAKAVRPGGIVAFHEVALDRPNQFFATPTVELVKKLSYGLGLAFEALLPEHDVASRLIPCFEDAGLPTPNVIWECIAGNHASPLGRWLALTYCSMLPHITKLGLADVVESDPEKIAGRLNAELWTARAQVVSRAQACAWVVRP